MENSIPNSTLKSKDNSNDDNFCKEHDWKRVGLIIGMIVMFIITLGFNTLSSLFYTPNSQLFKNNTGSISDKFYTDITPSGSTFTIWAFIYTWQGVWLAYVFISIFRKSNRSGDYLYLKPDFLYYGIFIAYIINLACNIIWIFLWGNEHIGWALLFSCIMTFALYLMLFISYRKLDQNIEILREEQQVKDIWLTRILMQNGVAFYATWLSIASNLNFAIYIIWRLGADYQNAGTGALILVLCAIIVYFILENFVWKMYLIYQFSPWIVIIVALGGVITKNYNASNPTRNSIIAVVMIAIASALIVARIVLFILYHTVWKHKLFGNKAIMIDTKTQNGTGVTRFSGD